jgi:hypothetical protein
MKESKPNKYSKFITSYYKKWEAKKNFNYYHDFIVMGLKNSISLVEIHRVIKKDGYEFTYQVFREEVKKRNLKKVLILENKHEEEQEEEKRIQTKKNNNAIASKSVSGRKRDPILSKKASSLSDEIAKASNAFSGMDEF